LTQGVTVHLDGPQAHYLLRVMRVAEGDAVILCDNVTGEWAARVIETSKRNLSLQVVEMLREREEVPDFWLCPALLKKDRFDMVLEKATELGVARIQPVITRRCVADRLNMDRATTIVTEAAEQCARTALPEVAEPVKLEQLLKNWPGDRLLFFADELGGEPAAKVFAEARESPDRRGPQSGSESRAEEDPRLCGGAAKVAILTGPEGGFDDAERLLIRDMAKSRPISLGPRILRGETAALAATSLWMGTAGDWN
jgi:16S rRNA (uracil1498-N3)-methyltransferase